MPTDKEKLVELLKGWGVAYTDMAGRPPESDEQEFTYLEGHVGKPCGSYLDIKPTNVSSRTRVVGNYWMHGQFCFADDGSFICIKMWE